MKKIITLPEYLQPRIISAVAYVHEVAPDIDKAVERIHNLQRQLSEKELMWVMSLLTFEKLLDIVKESKVFEKFQNEMKERTIQ
jgi:cell division protein ZapA (FtsZ GTPase activity inhibitor)